MIDQIDVELKAGEHFERVFDLTRYLLTGQTIASATVVHTLPDGSTAADSYTVTISGGTVGVVRAASPYTDMGWHTLDVVCELSTGNDAVVRYRVRYAG